MGKTRSYRCSSRPSASSLESAAGDGDGGRRRRSRQESISPSPSVSASIQDGNHFQRRHSRPRPWESQTTTSSACGRVSPFLLLAYQLSMPNEATATNNNLRQTQQQQGQSSSCIDQWHISIESPSSCTNSHVFPKEWADVSVRDFMFHNTANACCEDVISVSGKCDIINSCEGTDDGARQEVTNEYFDKVTCMKTTWHMSTEVLYACTNDDVYPAVWNDDPKLTEKFLFNSGLECCDKSYRYQVCDVIDTCPTPPPTQKPTPRPSRTRRPRSRPTPKPTSKPTPTPEPTPNPTTTPEWYVDRANSQCVMNCVDEPGRPCGGRKGAWEESFPDVATCCESIDWISAKDCMTTASPTRKKTGAPTRYGVQGDDENPTAAPIMHFDWYKEPQSNRCVQECEDEPGYPCGGKAGKWATRYPSVEECCATVPWMDFDNCATTASPVTASPTTTFPPTTSPAPTTVAKRLDATSKPTRRKDRTSRPTGSPTYRPTHDCPKPIWYLFKKVATSTCVNDATYNDDLVNPSMKSYVTFDSSEDCCMSAFAGSNCHVKDVCNPEIGWFAEYSKGWDDGHCISTEWDAPPKGRRTFDSQMECCLGGFLGQSSETCLSFL